MKFEEENLQKQISQLLDMIIKVANQDNKITADENSLIEIIKTKMSSLEDEFLKLINKQLNTELLATEVKNLIEVVLNQTVEKAKEDGVITVDEIVIIDRLAKFLRSPKFIEFFKSETLE